ncbi:MAG: V-type ATP synthase subunit F [Thiohalocapsa sp.]|jgi:vacuolar-type H+-ATPase subunit F/Vma7|uniref:V-type ATP synthase subunit F n=1 Tax=Thiohalocapsa sp. TaxID=2497641 RepID=UPI0025F0DC78|nr:V-type ATP synthase subunit F [Thiohalocapsa sp.]MCG6940246.1 V-type ATP synthase subunit F [Thiohalocapsa sp.]
MAARCVFIGDELSAAGWRLAGADCRTPAPAETPDLLRALLRTARDEAPVGLILITAEYAAALPQALLEEALAAQRPPCVVVADARGRVAPADLTAALKRQLGLAE